MFLTKVSAIVNPQSSTPEDPKPSIATDPTSSDVLSEGSWQLDILPLCIVQHISMPHSINTVSTIQQSIVIIEELS